MKFFFSLLLCSALLTGGCLFGKPGSSDAPPEDGSALQEEGENPLERAVVAYLDCTAEASVDAVLDGANLVRSQRILADQCASDKIQVLAGVGDEERAGLAQRLKEWDLDTLNAVRERLRDVEFSLKTFMDCSYVHVRDALSREYERPGEQFLESLVIREISQCYDGSLGDLLHPRMALQSPVGLARKDRVMLLAKERVMQELYKEMHRENAPAPTPPVRDRKSEVVAAR